MLNEVLAFSSQGVMFTLGIEYYYNNAVFYYAVYGQYINYNVQ